MFTRDDLPTVFGDDRRAELFIAKVAIEPGPIPEHDPDLGPCLLWEKCTEHNGYGRFRDGPERVYAHVWAYTRMTGATLPEGQEVDHLCHHPDYCPPGVCVHRRCINPGHLTQRSHRANVLRSGSFIARQAAQTHCHHGHPFTPENTVYYPSHPRSRKCRTCESAACIECEARRARNRNAEYQALKHARRAVRTARTLQRT